MKIGIIVYSKTGNTLSVAKLIKERIMLDRHMVAIETIEVSGNPDKGEFKIEKSPKIETYDYIILGSPVQAFSLNPVMIEYLNKIGSFNSKKVICYVTQYFPYPWMGGNRSISQMVKQCEDKNAVIVKTGIINWSSRKRTQAINNLVEEIGSSITK